MSIRNRIRTLGAAATLALTLVSMTVGPAHAESNAPAGGDVTCASVTGYEEVNGKIVPHYEFHAVGDVHTVIKNGVGQKIECQADGKYHEIDRVIPVPAGRRPVGAAPRPIGIAR